jgi:hypothetical protein
MLALGVVAIIAVALLVWVTILVVVSGSMVGSQGRTESDRRAGAVTAADRTAGAGRGARA